MGGNQRASILPPKIVLTHCASVIIHMFRPQAKPLQNVTKSKQLVVQVTHTDDSEGQVKTPSPKEVLILISNLDLTQS